MSHRGPRRRRTIGDRAGRTAIALAMILGAVGGYTLRSDTTEGWIFIGIAAGIIPVLAVGIIIRDLRREKIRDNRKKRLQ